METTDLKNTVIVFLKKLLDGIKSKMEIIEERTTQLEHK